MSQTDLEPRYECHECSLPAALAEGLCPWCQACRENDFGMTEALESINSRTVALHVGDKVVYPWRKVVGVLTKINPSGLACVKAGNGIEHWAPLCCWELVPS